MELMTVSKVVLALVLVAKVLARFGVGTDGGCVCGGKY